MPRYMGLTNTLEGDSSLRRRFVYHVPCHLAVPLTNFTTIPILFGAIRHIGVGLAVDLIIAFAAPARVISVRSTFFHHRGVA